MASGDLGTYSAWGAFGVTSRAGRRSDVAPGLAVIATSAFRVTVRAVRGTGRVGKTQLAVEYAYAHAGGYDLVR